MAISVNIPPDEKLKEKKFPPTAPIQTPIPEPEVDSNKYTNGCAMKMTRWLLLICVSCLVISALASPVLKSSTQSEMGTGRQAAADAVSNAVDAVVAAPAAAPVQQVVAAAPVAAAPAVTPDPEDDEDDEDDDDDDVDLDITDDDDDEEDDEDSETAADDDEDDDDDDYDFERFFDDLLGA